MSIRMMMYERLNEFELESRRNEMLSEIARISVEDCGLTTVPEDFRSGGILEIKNECHTLRARVEFDRHVLKVTLLFPFEGASVSLPLYYDTITYWHRKPTGTKLTVDGTDDGPATRECIESATDLMKEIYCDCIVLSTRKEHIRSKYRRFLENLPTIEEKERRRKGIQKERLVGLRAESHGLKQKFLRKEMSQELYVIEKKPIRKDITRLEEDLRTDRDLLEIFFNREFLYMSTRCDRGGLIKAVALEPCQAEKTYAEKSSGPV